MGKEVVILDDYDGDNHRLGVFDALTCEDNSQLRVMGDYETTRQGHTIRYIIRDRCHVPP